MYSAQARSSSALPSSPVTTKVTGRRPSARSNRPVAPATTKLAHSTSGASATASAPTVPAVVFCTTVRPESSADLIRPGEFTASKPAAGGPSLSAGQPGRLSFNARASSSDEARTIRSAPREGPGGDGEGPHHVDHDRDARNLGQLSDADATLIHRWPSSPP
ncbi:hypothetical protein AQJ23_19160 [Streptomyces antibioticus]|nr:hypothetical protein AQJ23_19160 [Streptomyces antibioticus]